jgi:DNA-binding MarR family transcriptional regulator
MTTIETHEQAADVDSLAHSLVVTCARFTRSVARLSPNEIPTAVWRTLAILDEHGALRISDLAVLNQCSQPTATGMVQRLEAEGDVLRVSDPTDRRAILVSLSEGGREHLRRLRSEVSTALSPQLQRLSPTRLDELDGALKTIKHLIDSGAASSDEASAVHAPNPSRPGR